MSGGDEDGVRNLENAGDKYIVYTMYTAVAAADAPTASRLLLDYSLPNSVIFLLYPSTEAGHSCTWREHII